MAANYINVGHMGHSGRKLLRNQYKIWLKERKGMGITQDNDFNTFLLAKYKMKPSVEKELKETV